MKINIYDYLNSPKTITLKDDSPVVLIVNKIISGDEVLTVQYEDGSCQRFDSSKNRIMSFYDGEDILVGEELKNFLESRKVEEDDNI